MLDTPTPSSEHQTHPPNLPGIITPTCPTPHLGQPPEKAIGHRDIDVVLQRPENVPLHPQEVFGVVGIVAQIDEVVHQRRTELLDEVKHSTVLGLL